MDLSTDLRQLTVTQYKTELNFSFWNIRGIFNLYNLHLESYTKLSSLDIITITETWHLDVNIKGQLKRFSGFDIFHKLATKDSNSTRGRASGGLLTMMNKNSFTNTCILYESDSWIITKAVHKQSKTSYIIINTYLNQSRQENTFIELHNIIQTIQEVEKPECLVVMGDFNSRVGDIDDKIEGMEQYVHFNNERTGEDKINNQRGKILMELMDDLDLVLLNGRTTGDAPAKYTYYSTSGNSTIDLIFLNRDNLFKVENLSFEDMNVSDHFLGRICLYEEGSQIQNLIPPTRKAPI